MHLLHHQSPSAQLIIAHTHRNAQSRTQNPRKAAPHEQASRSQRYPQDVMHPLQRHFWESNSERATDGTNTTFLFGDTSRRSLNSFATSYKQEHLGKKSSSLVPTHQYSKNEAQTCSGSSDQLRPGRQLLGLDEQWVSAYGVVAWEDP